MRPKLVFDHRFFEHVIAAQIAEKGSASRSLVAIEALLRKAYFVWPLSAAEYLLGFLLALPIPIYGFLIRRTVETLPGLPGMGGMYLRALYYRQRLGHMAPNVLIEQNVIFAHPETVELKSFSYIDKGVMILSRTAKIGRRVHLAPKVFISGGGDFIAQDYSCVATGARIVTSTEVMKNGARCASSMTTADQRNVLRGTVHLGRDAFVGALAVVLPNVAIAQGSVIGAGAVIAKDTQPWAVYIGSKASQIATRDPVCHPDT